MNTVGLQYLSDEILLKIFLLLDKPRHLCQLGSVCRRFHHISQDNAIWERLFVEHLEQVWSVTIPMNIKHQISWKHLFQRECKTEKRGIIIHNPSLFALFGSWLKSKFDIYESVKVSYRMFRNYLAWSLIGPQSCGKSCITTRINTGIFQSGTTHTIGAAFVGKDLYLRNGKRIHCDIWDTAGLPKFRSLIPMYTRGSNVVMIVYDITSQESFEGAKTYLQDVLHDTKRVTIMVFGNKVDLEEHRMVSKEEAIKFFVEENKCLWMEGSALTGQGIEEMLMKTMFQAVYGKYKKPEIRYQS